MKIAFVYTEVFPFAKTGGLADVAGSLPKEIAKMGCDVKIFMPRYNIIDEEKYHLNHLKEIGEITITINKQKRFIEVYKATMPDSGVEIYFIDCPHYFFRGQIYTNDPDEDERFILFSKGVIEVLQKLKWAPDIIHCNDWQTALIPLLIKEHYIGENLLNKAHFLFTIHNIGYQGIFSRKTVQSAGIGEKLFYLGGPVELYGNFNFMKAGIIYSDIITTVSPTYAREILTPEYGAGLENVLKTRENNFYGILNGVDYSTWDPSNDKFIPFRYTPENLSGKFKNKKFLLEQFNLEFDEKIPLIAIISRLVSQKGFEIVADVINQLMNMNAHWMIIGNGETKYEQMFNIISQKFHDRVGIHIGYNNELAHLTEAAADIFLMPSLYEPCGLNQIYSLKYGTVPVVRKTGGLNDTVEDWHASKVAGKETGTGFSFDEYSGAELIKCLNRAIDTFMDKPIWEKVQRNGMQKEFSWERAARTYMDLYLRFNKVN